jgi:solute carrier family 35 protein
VFLVLAIASGDFASFLQFESLYETEFVISITMVAVLGFCLNFCTNLCTMRNSPFAIALTHNVKVTIPYMERMYYQHP